MKPLDLAERLANAKVKKAEAEAGRIVLDGLAQAEVAKAQAYKMRRDADGEYERNRAEAQKTRAEAETIEQANHLRAKFLLDAKKRTSEELLAEISATVDEIRKRGGDVKVLEPPNPNSDDALTDPA
jgi:uncharacterized membrane protein YqiK